MNIKSQKGYTGIDIAIAVVVLFIFVSIIAMLSYSINSSAKEIDLKSEATAIAVAEIEGLKNKSFAEISEMASTNNIEQEAIANKEGFYKTIIIKDYNDISQANGQGEKVPGLVKQATVKISYQFKGETQSVELSTIFSKEN